MTRVRSVRAATGVVLWLAAAVAATAVGMFAVGAIGEDIFGADRRPLSESEVDEQLAGATTRPTTTPPAATSTRSTTSEPPAPRATPVTTDGGTVLARCAPGGLVDVLSTVPAQGFRVDSDDDELDGLDDHPHIKFESGEREIEIRLRCVGDTVTHTVEDD